MNRLAPTELRMTIQLVYGVSGHLNMGVFWGAWNTKSVQEVSKQTARLFRRPSILRGSRQSDSNRRPADYESVAFLEGRYLGHDA
jgi:hypothetical protein